MTEIQKLDSYFDRLKIGNNSGSLEKEFLRYILESSDMMMGFIERYEGIDEKNKQRIRFALSLAREEFERSGREAAGSAEKWSEVGKRVGLSTAGGGAILATASGIAYSASLAMGTSTAAAASGAAAAAGGTATAAGAVTIGALAVTGVGLVVIGMAAYLFSQNKSEDISLEAFEYGILSERAKFLLGEL